MKFGHILIIVILFLLFVICRSCVSCVQNMSKERPIAATVQKTEIVKDKDTSKKKIEKVELIGNSKTWSQMLKTKPKEIQIKQEELKAAMKKISKSN